MKQITLLFTAVLLALGHSKAGAQPLAEVARREQVRRAALAESDAVIKTYTNADLRGGGRLTTGSSAPAPPDDEAGAQTPDVESADPTPSADEDQWRARITTVRQTLARTELRADALQNRIDGLLADFSAVDDPAQRSVIERARQAAIEELGNTRVEIEDLTRQIDDIREEARRANIPPGWLR